MVGPFRRRSVTRVVRPQTPGAAEKTPLVSRFGSHRRSASIGPSRYRIPGIATTEKKVGKRIWGKGMGAERNSHTLARNSLAIIFRDDCLIAIGVDRRPRDCRRIGRAVR
jgi:hypothetical protein